MNSSLLFLTLLVLLLLLLSNPSSSSEDSQLFEAWCKEYGKSYSSEEEEVYRRSVFEENLALITQRNEMGFSYTLSLNSFSDMTLEEFRASRLGYRPMFLTVDHNAVKKPSVASDVPSEIDWRKKGAVTSVKDQGSCGSSWAFSAIGAIEGINKIVTGSLISLSEQELMDCNKGPTTSSCSGGHVSGAFQFVIKNNGIDTDVDYPYQAWDMDCNEEKVNRRVVTIDSFKYVPLYDEEQLLQAVARQPVSATITASTFGFQFYSKGIVTGSRSNLLEHGSLDHAVLIVGYGSENGVDFWILKNSWGKQWGMDGYMYLLRDHGNRKGLYGINMLALYPIKTGANPPPPGPVNCDANWHCNGGETCCCWMPFRETCLSWTCCDNFGVCCEDLIHCCPPDYPICDTERKLCLQAYGNLTMEVLKKRINAGETGTHSVAEESRQPQKEAAVIEDWHVPIPPSSVEVLLTDTVSYFLLGGKSSADRIPIGSALNSSKIVL